MPRIRCRYEDCVFLEEGYCGAAAIELEPDTGCLTYSRVDESESAEDEWEEDEFDEEEEELYDEEEDEDLWDEDDDDDDEY
jgi:hypothetical protein